MTVKDSLGPQAAAQIGEPQATSTELGRFSDVVAERLGFYVYLLTDPRDGQIFYVGKGKGNRVFAHAEAALDEQVVNAKLDRIRAIRAEGHQVRYELLRFGLSDIAAFAVEAAAIQLLDGLGVQLDNLVAGHHIGLRGRMSTDVAISILDAPPAPPITQPTLLIRIPDLWEPTMDRQQLLEATRGWWLLDSSRARGAKYAFTVSKSVVRAVWRIDPSSWRQQAVGDRGYSDRKPGERARWGFEASFAEDMQQFMNRSVKHLYRRGDQSAFRYLNC